jgi:hypothetical protein
MESEPKQVNTSASKKSAFYVVALLVLIFLGSFFPTKYFFLGKPSPSNTATMLTPAEQMKTKQSGQAYALSAFQNDPSQLQDRFLTDLRNGTNDRFTKEYAYFITHRFFDNGGNIYEIYDYVKAHKELDFLNEAEKIYPDIFAQISKKDKTVTFTQSMYAYLAYLEVLISTQYADIATIGTAANQYAKLVYFAKELAKKMPDDRAQSFTKNVERNTQKATEMISLGEKDVSYILEHGGNPNVTNRDVLVGMNQYGAALRYLQAAGVTVDTPVAADKIFSFSENYAATKYDVRGLQLFTSLLDASTLVLNPAAPPDQVRVALAPIIAFDVEKIKPNQYSIIYKIIDSRTHAIPENPAKIDLDVYGKYNAMLLAAKVPEFKSWLMKNGWTESDFK